MITIGLSATAASELTLMDLILAHDPELPFSRTVSQLTYSLVLAFLLSFIGRRLERGNHRARIALFAVCAWFVAAGGIVGLPFAVLLVVPVLLPASRRYFQRTATLAREEEAPQRTAIT